MLTVETRVVAEMRYEGQLGTKAWVRLAWRPPPRRPTHCGSDSCTSSLLPSTPPLPREHTPFKKRHFTAFSHISKLAFGRLLG